MADTPIPSITSVASASADTVLGVASGVVRRFPLNTLLVSYTGTGTGAVSRTVKSKIEEIERSVIDFGADPTGVADSTTAFTNAIAASRVIRIPAGTYRVSSITVNRSVWLKGDGRNHTHIQFTTTTNHGMILIGESALGLGNVIRMTGLHLEYVGAGQAANCKGLLVQRKLLADEVHVEGFTGDGIYFAPSNANPLTGAKGTITNCVFFAVLSYVRSSSNGGNGCVVRLGANANTFFNCQFDRNSLSGFRHHIDGTDDNSATGSTYGNLIIAGQASYNSNYGYYLESGTNIQLYAAYAEQNWSPNNTGLDGDRYIGSTHDFYLGDNIVRSWINMGVLYSVLTDRVRLPLSGTWGASTGGNTAQIQVWEGGRRGYGAT